MKEDQLLEDVFNLDPLLSENVASTEQVAAFEKVMKLKLPSLLKKILQKSNGGEFAFGRFITDPFIVEDIAGKSAEEIWDALLDQSALEEHELIQKRKVLPFADDYGGQYWFCLDIKSGEILELDNVMYETKFVAQTFNEFIEKALEAYWQDMAKENKVQKGQAKIEEFPFELDNPQRVQFWKNLQDEDLKRLGVAIQFVNLGELIHAASRTPWLIPDDVQRAHEEGRVLAYRLEPLREDAITMVSENPQLIYANSWRQVDYISGSFRMNQAYKAYWVYFVYTANEKISGQHILKFRLLTQPD